MTTRFAGLAAGCTLLIVAGCNQAPGDRAADAAGTSADAAATVSPLPATVATALASIATECSAVGGTPHTERAVQRADLNADGREDYVLFTGWIDCENAASIYGDRAKSLALFTGDGQADAAETFADWTYDAVIEGDGTAARLWLTVTGEQCGRPPARDFASEAFCERAIEWNPVTGRFDYAPVGTVRMIE